jgi:RNA polymerase sigma-70 factor, ECF subfamily
VVGSRSDAEGVPDDEHASIGTHQAATGRGVRPSGATFVTTVETSEEAMAQVSTDRLDARWAESLDRVRAFVAARVDDDGLAADITHDVVVRSIASGALDRVDNPTAWLYRSARNAVIDHYRTRRVHAPLDGTERWPEPGPTDNQPNEATRDLARCLQPLLHELPPAARDALTRVDVDGQTHQQAADQLGLSVSGMKSRVQRARRQLKDLLQECCLVGLDRTGAVVTYRPATGTCGCGAPTCADIGPGPMSVGSRTMGGTQEPSARRGRP